MAGGLEFTVEQKALREVAKALRQESDGKQLRKDLIAAITAVLTPLREEVRGSILSMESGGLPHEGQGLRQAIAEKTVVQVRTGGRATGAAIRTKNTGMPRGFKHAARRLNARKGWRHPVFARVTRNGEVDVWVRQVGKPEWFDDTIRKHRRQYTRNVTAVLAVMARRIASRSH